MSIGKVFATGCRENFKGAIKLITIVLICIVPLLYSFFYLKAFWDPYKNLTNMPVAIVNEDAGANGVNYGDDLISNLHGSTAVQWHFVGRAAADAGLRDKTYYAEFVIPADFSSSVQSGAPGAANIELYADSKNNFMATLLATNVENQIISLLSRQISEEAVKTLLLSTVSGGQQLQTGAGQLSEGAKQLESSIITITDSMAAIGENLLKATQDDPSLLSNTNIAAALQTLSDFQKNAPQSSGQDPMAQLAAAADDYMQGVTQYMSGISALNSGTAAAFISSPVGSIVTDLEPVPHYGTGFAPYFTSLSLWIGALLMSIVIGFRFGKDKEKWKATGSVNAVVGRFLVFACVGALQALLLTLTVKVLGIEPQSWLMVFLAFVVGSLVSVAIITMLMSLLGRLGQLLSMVVLIFQLSASGGTFPLPLTSTGIFTSLHPFVPFTYSIQALKEAISGNPINYGLYWRSLAVLGLIILGCLIVCILFRRPSENITDRLSARLHRRGAEGTPHAG